VHLASAVKAGSDHSLRGWRVVSVSNNILSQNQVYGQYPANKMDIVIVGAGLGGLAAALAVKSGNPAHKVLVIESAPQLAEVGAYLNCSGCDVVLSLDAKLTCGSLTR
jgi:threonine dehydrogenase-like Zn-dependent dehydrogenase